MNPIPRRRIPPSVRRLLTDISPKEDNHCIDWDDTETPEAITADGIQLPPRAPVNHEEFLKPANIQGEQGTEDGESGTGRSLICGVCKSKPYCYTCPRCNVPYCSLPCYRSPDHSACSEEFYKESVLKELKDTGHTEVEGKKKMQEILLGLRQQASSTEGGMESLLSKLDYPDGEVEEDEVRGRAETLELLSRLAQLQQTGCGDSEMEDILKKLEVIGGQDFSASAEDFDHEVEGADDDDDEEPDLAERLAGVDINTLSEEALWELLDSREKEKFLALVKSKEVSTLVPLWRPWWEVHKEDSGARTLVEEVLEEESRNKGENSGAGAACKMREEELKPRHEEKMTDASLVHTEADNKGKKSVKTGQRKSSTEKPKTKGERQKKGDKSSHTSSRVPPISSKIPKLSSLSSNPSPLVCNGLINALFSYAFTLCLFNGDTESMLTEFCDTVLALSEALHPGRVFGSLQEALESGEAAITASGHLDPEDSRAPTRAVEAVAHIATGRSRGEGGGYCLAALSHLRSALSQARSALPKGDEGEEPRRRRYFLAGKKCEFYQAWVCENLQLMRTLAVELWNEHAKREGQRWSLERDVRAVEEGWKKGQRKGNGVMIEELS